MNESEINLLEEAEIEGIRSIANIHDAYVEIITSEYEGELNLDESYVNQKCESILNDLNRKKNNLLSELNEFRVELDNKVTILEDDKLSKLNEKIKETKNCLIDFGHSQEENYKLNLQNVKSTKEILNKIFQYSCSTSFTKKTSTFELPYGFTIHKNSIYLPTNENFIFLRKAGLYAKAGKIMIVDNQSNIVKSKDIQLKKCLNKASFEASNKHIICLYPEEAVFVYDFSLNLVKSFKLEDNLNYIKIYNDEYAICGSENYRTISYDENNASFQLSSSKRMKQNCKLVHFNHKFLYYYHHDGSLLYVVDRNDVSSIRNYFDVSCREANKINDVLKFDKDSQMFYLNLEKDLVEAYDQNGDLMFNLEFKKDKTSFKLIGFTQFNKIFTSISFVFDDILFMVYDEF